MYSIMFVVARTGETRNSKANENDCVEAALNFLTCGMQMFVNLLWKSFFLCLILV